MIRIAEASAPPRNTSRRATKAANRMSDARSRPPSADGVTVGRSVSPSSRGRRVRPAWSAHRSGCCHGSGSRTGLVRSGMRRAGRVGVELEGELVDVAPQPFLTRLVALHDGMSGRSEMCGRMSVRRAVAATDVAAFGAPPKVQPARSDRQTVLAPRAVRAVDDDRVEVAACAVAHRVESNSAAVHVHPSPRRIARASQRGRR